jgi:O-antigen ligase
MLVYIFSAVLALAPVLQAVFDLPLQLAFQRAVLAGCLAWLFLGLRTRGFPRGLLEKRFYPLWAAAALSLISLIASPFRGSVFNEWGNYAAGLLIFVFASFLDAADRAKAVRAMLWGAWLVFGFSLFQAFALGTFASHPPLTNLNALALYAVMVIPAALGAGMWPLAGAMIILMVWTQSVGAALAALAAAGFYAAGRLKGKELKENAWLLAALAALAAGALYLLQADSVAGRLAWWKSAWDMFAARPVNGFGQASFTWAQAMFQGSGAFREHAIYAHNYYLEYLAENGFPAALAWFWLLFTAARARSGLINYSVIAALAHSFVDFGLSVPANFWVFCFLLSSPAEAEGAVPSRGAAARALGLALPLAAALVSLDLRSLAYERARGRALDDASSGAAALAEAELRPALAAKLFRAPALEFLGRLNLAVPGREFPAAVYYEEALLENRYSAESWRALKKIYAAPGRERDAAGLESRRREVYR